MNYVEKLFDQVQSSLSINAATLSGAIDILVVPQLDGSLKCTPFHVRFGKLQLISSSEKVVSILVNGVKTDLQMKLGHAGEAFFVEETEEPVPSILATSPITSPKPGRTSKTSTEELVTEFMNSRVIPKPKPATGPLPGLSASTPPSSTTPVTTTPTKEGKDAPHQTLSSVMRDFKDPKDMKPLTEALQERIMESEKKKSAQEEISLSIESPIGGYVVNCEPEIVPKIHNSMHNVHSASESSDSETEPKVWRWGGLPKFIRRNKAEDGKNAVIVEDVESSSETESSNITPPIQTVSPLVSSSEDIPVMPSDQANPPQGWTRSLLKMFNKKETTTTQTTTTTTTTTTTSSTVVEPSYIVKPPSTSPTLKESSPRVNNIIDGGEIFLLDEEQESAQTNDTEEPLNSTYASIVRESAVPSSPPKQSVVSPPPPKLSDIHEFPPLTSPHPMASLKKRHSMSNLLALPIQLSLCGHLIQDRNLINEPEEKETFFKEYLISFDQFQNDFTLLKNPHLVAKIGDYYYPWSVAGHLILSQLIFNRPISVEALDQLKKFDKEERAAQVSSLNNSTSSLSASGSGVVGPSQPPTNAPKSTWKWWWKSNNPNPNSANVTLPPSSSPINVPSQGSAGQPPYDHKTFTKKTLRPTSAQLQALGLKKGQNRITFSVSSKLQGTREVSASIYFWENNTKIVISDIDGTITKSDVFGQVLPWIGKDWSHGGVAELYSNIKQNGYQIIYLTSRAIGQAAITRTYISSVKQISNSNLIAPPPTAPATANGLAVSGPSSLGSVVISNPSITATTTTTNSTTTLMINAGQTMPGSIGGATVTISQQQSNAAVLQQPLSHFTLPEGPVFMSPNRLLSSLNREVIKRNPEEFKIACLQDIQNLFPPGATPFYAGFGNRNTDAIAYNAVGVPTGKTFTINPLGVINTTNTTYNKTYTKLNDLVQDMFPQPAGKHSVDEQWNEYNYWKKSIIPSHKLDPI